MDVSSVAGLIGPIDLAAYGAAKARNRFVLRSVFGKASSPSACSQCERTGLASQIRPCHSRLRTTG